MAGGERKGLISQLFPTLRQLCANRIAHCFDKDSLPNKHYILNKDDSEFLFKHFSRDLIRKCANEIIEKFTLSNVSVYNLDADSLQIAFTSDLVDLSICLANVGRSRFHLERERHPQGVDRYYPRHIERVLFFLVDIMAALVEMVNEKSRHSLRRLALTGEGDLFPRGWTRQMVHFLPNIEHLSLTHLSLPTYDFRALCYAHPNLTVLDISSTDLRSLRGISQLSNLRVLSMNCVEFDTKEEVSDIFGCRELRSLNISSTTDYSGEPFFARPSSKNLRLYLSCDDSLPNLEFLDCSCNFMTQEELEKLVASHPKLRSIVLLGTVLELSSSFNFPNVKLLSFASMEQAIDTLEYFEMKDESSSLHAVQHIRELLDTKFEQVPNEQLLRLVATLITSLNSKVPWTPYLIAVVGCISIMMENDDKKTYSFDDKQAVIKTLLHFDNGHEENKDLELVLQDTLSQDALLFHSPDNVRQICHHAIAHITARTRPEFQGNRLPGSCSGTLCKCFKKLPEDEWARFENLGEMKLSEVVWFLIHPGNRQQIDEISPLVELFWGITLKVYGEDLDDLERMVKKLLDVLVAWEDPTAQISIIKFFIHIAYYGTDRYSLYFKPDIFDRFSRFLNNPSPARVVTIQVFAFMKYHVTRPTATDYDQYNDVIETLSKEIAAILEAHNHEEVDGVDGDKLEMYRWLVEHAEGKKEVVEWAEWMMKMLGRESRKRSAEEDDEEPVEKRARMETPEHEDEVL